MTAPTYHVMIDMETLDNVPTAVVLSWGAVLFTKDKILAESYMEFNIDPQLRDGRTISADTLAWWFRQSQEATNILSQNGRVKEYLAATYLKDFWEPLSKALPDKGSNNPFYQTYIWSNGASFDLPIMEHVYRQLETKSPFFFGRHKCFRTFKDGTKCDELVPRQGVHHNALDDAKWQAECCIAHWNRKKKA
jgi:hypothetical protein